ncbi:GNAT family N-acetyltransferase [Actinomycetaceae bacterium MB13-C1-2]|nr:GNAT family N-acetyltransferase [Actinomycetaceae bacterium MB13-C1-2]
MGAFGLSSRSRVWGVPAGNLVREYRAADLAELLRPESSAQEVIVRPAMGSDALKIESVRRANRDWLEPWEATIAPGSNSLPPTWGEYSRRMNRSMKEGTGLLIAVVVDGDVAGCVTLGAVERGSMSQGTLGYWIGQRWAGQGVTALAAATVIDMVILELGLHRIEINVRPENNPSLGVCRRIGVRQEAYKPRFMSIAGQWADHIGFGVDREDLQRQTMIQALRESRYETSTPIV